jgi:cytochrome c5
VSDTRAVLELARDLLSRADPSTAGLWPRAAALLTRQALEEAVDAYWAARQLPLGSLPTQTQLVCMRMMTADGTLPAQLHEVWGALSRACHHHPYELAPTVGELGGWIQLVAEFADSRGVRPAVTGEESNL